MADKKTIPNGEEIIERFGGIRPMAGKLEVPVTTVQGWKKRNAIPRRREEQIIQAALEHNIELSDLMELTQKQANENNQEADTHAEPTPTPHVTTAAEPTHIQDVDEMPHKAGNDDAATTETTANASDDNAEEPESSDAQHEEASSEAAYKARGEQPLRPRASSQMLDKENKSMQSSLLFYSVLSLGAFALAGAALWFSLQTSPEISQVQEEIAQIEANVENVEETQSLFSNMIPQDLEAQINSVREQAVQAQESVTQAIEKAEQISNDVLGENAGTIQERLTKLEQSISEITATPELQNLTGRVQELQASLLGQDQLANSVTELSAIVSGMQGQMDNLEPVLDQARDQSTSLSQTLDGVPSNDLKAAAMLIALSQFRGAVNRDNEPFQDDLVLLMNLVGQDDPALQQSLEQLAPHADGGVLSLGGLSTELRTMTGDIVVASLKGEDVSIEERAQARINELFAVEKDGELITGTPTQSKLDQTQKLLDQGDLAGAISIAQTLQGPAAQAAAPWLKQAQASLLASNVQDMLGQAINLNGFSPSSLSNIGLGDLSVGGSELIQNKDLGINILSRPTMEPMGLSPKTFNQP